MTPGQILGEEGSVHFPLVHSSQLNKQTKYYFFSYVLFLDEKGNQEQTWKLEMVTVSQILLSVILGFP